MGLAVWSMGLAVCTLRELWSKGLAVWSMGLAVCTPVSKMLAKRSSVS
jgi:hypothetical protein